MHQNVLLVAVPYSPNLGDGIIGFTLGKIYEEKFASKTKHLDFAGREGLEGINNNSRIRTAFINISNYLPNYLSNLLVEKYLDWQLAKKKESWTELVEWADIVIFGGGNIFSDVDLNFPIKMNKVFQICKAKNKKIAIQGVGVASNWSKKGTRLFQNIFDYEHLIYCTVRDENSAIRLKKYVQSKIEINYSCDPVVSLSRFLMPNENKEYLLGISVTHPNNLRYSGDVDLETSKHLHLEQYVRIYELFSNAYPDETIAFFTNGAFEDEEYLISIKKLFLKKNYNKVVFLDRANNPEELITYINQCKSIIGYRLHASITAYALGIPSICISWDSKVNAFFERIGHIERVKKTLEEITEAEIDLHNYHINNDIKKTLIDNIINESQHILQQAK